MLLRRVSILINLKRSTFHFKSLICKVFVGIAELVDEQLLNGGNIDDDASGSGLKMDHLWSQARDFVPHCKFFGWLS
jgi:hypothetical protein